MKKVENIYQPINCNYYDYMEHYATLRKPITIRFTEDEQVIELNQTIIQNLSGGRNGEFIHVNIDGKEKRIRMDHIISVDDVEAKQFSSESCQSGI